MSGVLLILQFACISAAGANTLINQDDSVLPFIGSDVLLMSDGSGRVERHTGQIEDIKGETMTFRLNGRSKIRFIRMTDVVELRMTRGKAWENGRAFQAERQLSAALNAFDAALQQESRDWAWNEIQANAVIACIQQGQRKEAVRRIEQILDRDDRSRHVSLVPLVWDERILLEEHEHDNDVELSSRSEVRQLMAASALLHLPNHQANATLVLRRLQKKSRLSRIRELAEAQLWRLAFLDTSEKTRALDVWTDRVESISVESRHGPMFALGRCAVKNYDYDRAATLFLWTALMSPIDERLAAQALGEAITCLRESGRNHNAADLAAELQQRYPDSPAAQASTMPPVP